MRRWVVAAAVAGAAAVATPLVWLVAGPVGLATVLLLALGMVLVLAVDVLTSDGGEVVSRPVLWHPDDFVVQVHRSSGRVVRVDGAPVLGRSGAGASTTLRIDDVLVAPPFASLRASATPTGRRSDVAFPARWRAVDGTLRRTETVVVDEGETVALYARDVTAALDELDRLALRATTDPLTGLPNRSVLDRSVRSAAARAARTGEAFAVAVIDLDGFKEVNDLEGHRVGDRLLAGVAHALQGSCRAGDDVVRLGGDELLLVARDLTGWGEAQLVAERARRAVRRGSGGRVGASIGLVLASGPGVPGVDPSTLVSRADAAMYQAKRAGGDRVRLVVVRYG